MPDETPIRRRQQQGPGDAPSRTHQSFKDDCDINRTMRLYANNGQLPRLNPKTPTYGDFSDAGTYLEARQRVDLAMEGFNSLPAKVRRYCDDDPANFLDALESPENVQDMIDLGLDAKMIPGNEPEPQEPDPPPNPEPVVPQG